MSRGALLQLIAKGEIDNFLIDSNSNKNSIFNNVVKKITNFSQVPVSYYPDSANTWGDNIRFTIKKIGDLLTTMYLVLELPALSVEDIDMIPRQSEKNSEYRIKWNDYIGNLIVENVIFKIGGQKIDEMTGEYMQFHTELYDTTWSKLCLIGHEPVLNAPQYKIDKQFIYIPFRFFFCDDISKALPIVALEYHEIEIEVKLRNWEDLYLVLKEIYINDNCEKIYDKNDKNNKNNKNDKNDKNDCDRTISKINFLHTCEKIKFKKYNNIRLDCNTIFLDAPERKEVVKKRHEILITQTQKLISHCAAKDSIYLNFTNPIKELIFAFQNRKYYNLGEIYNFSGKPKYIPHTINGIKVEEITESLWNSIPDKHLLDFMNIEFDGIERVPVRDYKYWHFVQNYENYRTKIDHNLYMYNFGISTKNNMGSCNFSMLDTVKLNIKLADLSSYYYNKNVDNKILIGHCHKTMIKMYGNNYNILVIESGMGGLMFTI